VTPYYADDAVTIYHGDALDLVATLDQFDTIVTDPPYGIGVDTDYTRFSGNAAFARSKGRNEGRVHPRVHGDAAPFDPTWMLTHPTALFGADHYHDRLPLGGTWHAWDKREELGTNMLADFETWWTSYPTGPSRLFRYKWLGYFRAGEVGAHYHPTQKPEALMRFIIAKAPPGIVLDPYMGSGTTLRAAKDLGRQAIGIEINEAYCEIAARRCGQGVMDFGGAA
jgi:site-specific DNA-methyltransferase (adenine-specific)